MIKIKGYHEDGLPIIDIGFPREHALMFGEWLIENCIIAREGFRIGTSNWSEVISNERAYELYLESLKNK